jgi:hypothetical protein
VFGVTHITRRPTRLKITTSGSYTRPANASPPTPLVIDGKMIYGLPKFSGRRSR